MSDPDRPESRNRLTKKQTTASHLSGTSTPTSFRSVNSQVPLTMDVPDLLVPPPATDSSSQKEDEEENKTYFLLDIQTPDEETDIEVYLRSSSPSSSSSESAQIVIDSGIFRPSQYDHNQNGDGRQHQEVSLGDDTRTPEGSALSSGGLHSSGVEGARIMTIFTDEEDDLMDEMPRWNQEVMHRRHSLLEEDQNADSDWVADKAGHRNRRDRQSSYISSSRRDSNFSRSPGLSSDEALK